MITWNLIPDRLSDCKGFKAKLFYISLYTIFIIMCGVYFFIYPFMKLKQKFKKH